MPLVAAATAPSANGTDATTGGVDTTTATLLLAALSFYNGTASVVDSYGNTWTPLTASLIDSFFDAATQMWYVANPVVGPGHTVTVTALNPTVRFAAFSGVAVSSPLLDEAGVTAHFAAASFLNTPTLTPAISGVLAVSSCGASAAATSPTLAMVQPDYADWTIESVDGVPSVNEELGFAFKETTALTGLYCTWTHFAVQEPTRAVAIALFRLGDGGGGEDPPTYTDGTPGPLSVFEIGSRAAELTAYSLEQRLNDLGDYYAGEKAPRVQRWGTIRRALSDSSGQLEHPRASATLSDISKDFRSRLADPAEKYLTNLPAAIRTVTDADRRARLPMRTEFVGYVGPWSPSPDLRFEFTLVSWLKRKLSRRNKSPEYWQPLLTREDFPLLPDDLVNKAAPFWYGPLSDDVSVDGDLYPREGRDPNWLALGYNHLAASGPTGDRCAYVTCIKDGRESTVIPFMVGFSLDGSQQAYIYFRTVEVPDLYRVTYSDGRDSFHPILNPLGGTFARYQDFDPNVAGPTGCAVEDTNPFGGDNTVDQKRFVLIDSDAWGADYRAIATDGSVKIEAGTGPVPGLVVGDETYGGITRTAVLIGRYAVKEVIAAYVNGVKQTSIGSSTELEVPFLGDYGAVFGANYRDINSRRYTIAYVTGQLAIDIKSGAKALTFSLLGIETVGDTSGTLIASPVRQKEHFETNFLAEDAPPLSTWLPFSRGFPHVPGLTLVDHASYDVAAAALEAILPGGGFETAGGIGVGGEHEQALDILAGWQLCEIDSGVNHLGQEYVSVEPSEAPDDADVVTLSHERPIIDKSFGAESDPERDFFNVLPFDHTKDYTGRSSTGWILSGSLPDQDSIDNHQQTQTAEVVSLRFCRATTARGADTVVAIMQRRRRRFREPLRPVRLTVPYLHGGPRIELGSILRVTHFEGLSSLGWQGHDLRVRALEIDLSASTVAVEAYDLGPIYGPLADADPSEHSNIRSDSVIGLRSNVQNAEINIAALQAQITLLDARLSEVESGVYTVRTADPSSPTDGSWWFFSDEGSPASFSLRVRRGGVTQDFPVGTEE